MNLVSLPRFNTLRFPQDPVPDAKLWRWCRTGKLPARKVGREWFVDLDAFDQAEQSCPVITTTQRTLDILRRVS